MHAGPAVAAAAGLLVAGADAQLVQPLPLQDIHAKAGQSARSTAAPQKQAAAVAPASSSKTSSPSSSSSSSSAHASSSASSSSLSAHISSSAHSTSTTKPAPPLSSSSSSKPATSTKATSSSTSPAKSSASSKSTSQSSSTHTSSSAATKSSTTTPTKISTSSTLHNTSSNRSSTTSSSAASLSVPSTVAQTPNTKPPVSTDPSSFAPAPTSLADSSKDESGFMHNTPEKALVFTFAAAIALLLLIGAGVLLWRRRNARVAVADMDEFRRIRRADSTASSRRGPTSSNSSTRFSGVPEIAQDMRYQPQRLTQPLRTPAFDLANFASETAEVHRTIYPDPPVRYTPKPRISAPIPIPVAPRRPLYDLYPDILPPLPPPPPLAVRPSSPDSTYDQESMHAAAPRRPFMIERRPVQRV